MIVAYYISENKSDRRGIQDGWYAIEDGGNISDRRETRVGSARPPSPSTSYLRQSPGFLGSENWTGKGERRAECLYFNLSVLVFADILAHR